MIGTKVAGESFLILFTVARGWVNHQFLKKKLIHVVRTSKIFYILNGFFWDFDPFIHVFCPFFTIFQFFRHPPANFLQRTDIPYRVAPSRQKLSGVKFTMSNPPTLRVILPPICNLQFSLCKVNAVAGF